MTINELLQQTFNATEEQVSAFLEAMKNNKIFTTSEENMDIRFGKMKTQRDSVTEQLTKANATIEELQKANAGNDQLQQTVTAYQAENEKLKAQLNEAMIESEAKVSLLAEGVRDIDYAMFKLKATGQLEMGEDGKVKDLAGKIDALKTQIPDQFAGSGKKTYQENKLPEHNDEGEGITKESLLKKPYAERMRIYTENPEAYKSAMNSEQ